MVKSGGRRKHKGYCKRGGGVGQGIDSEFDDALELWNDFSKVDGAPSAHAGKHIGSALNGVNPQTARREVLQNYLNGITLELYETLTGKDPVSGEGNDDLAYRIDKLGIPDKILFCY